MLKLIFSDSFDPAAETGARLMTSNSNLVKRASTIFGCDYSELKPDKDHVGIHLVALGDAEHYGPNRNFDFFAKQACIDYHDTFVKNGNVYQGHINKDPKKARGIIKASAYNEDMGRIELFIHAHKEKAAEDLERMEKENTIPVSMACVSDPDYPVLTVGGYKRITDIVVGDVVLTHKGNWKRVTKLHRRKYTGKLIKLFIYGLSFPLEITSDHKMLAKLFDSENRDRLFKTQEGFDASPIDWFCADHYNVNDRLIYIPPGKYNGYGAIDDVDLAKIMGYYLAEGSFIYNGDKACTVQFSCHIDDSAVREIPKIVERILPEVTCTIRPHSTSSVCATVSIHNTHFAEYLRKYVGRGVRNKYICPEIFNASDTVKLAYLGAWLDGDGFVDIKGMHWSTCNYSLVLQGRDLLATLGIASSTYKIRHTKPVMPIHPVNPRDRIEYTLNISKLNHASLQAHSEKVSNYYDSPELNRCRPPAMRKELNSDRYTYRIKDIETRDVEDITVYNFEVEDDESYVLAGMASHNCKVAYDVCSICKTKRKSASDPDQCDHIKNHFGEISEDGKVAGTYNPEPNFFDISFVRRPADRIAWDLKKVASTGVVSSIDLAKEHGLVLPPEFLNISDTGLAKAALCKALADLEVYNRSLDKKASLLPSERFMKELRKAACAELTDEQVSTLRNFDPSLVFSKLASKSIVLGPESFFKYAFGCDYGDLKNDMPEIISTVRNNLFDNLVKKGQYKNVCNNSYFDVDTDKELGYITDNVKLGNYINNLVEPLSFLRGSIDKRAIENTIKGVKVDMTPYEEQVTTPNVKAAADLYAAYKLSALKAVIDRDEVDKDLLLKVAAVQGTV